MGEEGPEAIMPLKRGPDGSLGVQMHEGTTGSQRIELLVRAVEGRMFRPVVEAIAEEKSVKVTQVGIAQFNEQLPERVNQIANDDRVR